ncbi:MAG TPA: PEP-CTERM sorting domain-containing protein [Phycisphaerae bacterium]|nr:PEP-CTERM sorting domain-containing protein [Phycisphaerae bacterium]
MKKLIAIATIMMLVSPVLADWNPGDPAKWVQLPDLTPEGVDVNATATTAVLADDFECTSTGLITDIHIWGSWLNDILPPSADGTGPDPGFVAFRLIINSDIPAVIGPGGVEEHSTPGVLLWMGDFYPGDFAVREYATVDPGEGWYDPNTGEYIWPADKTVWQYNFLIDPADAFLQEGTLDNPIVYWLAVEAFTYSDEFSFGWKTSKEHWNDDAVWRNLANPWNELRYPSEHPFAGKSMDMAFVITPEPATMVLLGLGSLGLLLRRRR